MIETMTQQAVEIKGLKFRLHKENVHSRKSGSILHTGHAFAISPQHCVASMHAKSTLTLRCHTVYDL